MNERGVSSSQESEPSINYQTALAVSKLKIFAGELDVACLDGVVVAVGKGLTREQVAEQCDITPGYSGLSIQNIDVLRKYTAYLRKDKKRKQAISSSGQQ